MVFAFLKMKFFCPTIYNVAYIYEYAIERMKTIPTIAIALFLNTIALLYY